MGAGDGFSASACSTRADRGAADEGEALAWMLCAARMGDEAPGARVRHYRLDSAATAAAAQRVRMRFSAKSGIAGHNVRLRDLDVERAPTHDLDSADLDALPERDPVSDLRPRPAWDRDSTRRHSCSRAVHARR